ncbi:phosphopyruvate hydratase [Candidatus Woesebacteria bacterium RIFCSPLOWO2_01_FULL_39_23]|uniref:Enolase n=1 Tax=Candidatus Woesebacteria bacterium RIFCSPHIGHO2_01_FULL_40_22 TaxID=1802499 RepID=A0A1F7YJK7_9BACT|nr:MAG: phosphopyruvate hydratase [Candidatus Woesebacteria bacterium RBG_16_40_11]OGM27452.1 MAG: phosphopyruvate hydratase [Candidatus Woesebacteria bacterium RIFCSPHIGHO2_01_FULL_40_22]OGM36590.1 MAG: phosphopyruvate hydratase [Candidatus Woesebacteria bacterium RIFCSPHIGHO2_12_FULL_38_9]OGM62626.1 MAG: phosphopyruvate hydratase [Candidatus Woesebacteria bacterium RIFCSPLOWO2_01_FULL_39_23]
MSKISKIWAREILDSRAIPTVEASCLLDTGQVAIASVPSATPTGKYDSLELRDQDTSRYHGKGVLKAVNNVNNILGQVLIGMDPIDQEVIDKKLIDTDGTKNKSKYGANAILAVSIATAKAGSLSAGKTLYSYINQMAAKFGIKAKEHIPTPIFNMINGGLHGAGNLDFQEFHVIPATSKKFSEGLRMGVETYMTIGDNLKRRGAIHSVGDEGGYAPNLFTNADAFEILVESIKETPYQLGRDVFLGLDAAASVFYKNGNYSIRDKSSPLTDDDLLEYYKTLNNQYHLAILEDAFQEDAWNSWKKLYTEMSEQLTVVGDDLLATNPERVVKAIKEKACNAILVKPNQLGTITETLRVISKALASSWKIIVSHRSGETNEWFIADFAVGIGADFVKFGAPSRGERVAKYNRLSAIEVELLSGRM